MTTPDFATLLDVTSLPSGPGPGPEHLEQAVVRWNVYLAHGTFASLVSRDATIGVSDDMANFWTSPRGLQLLLGIALLCPNVVGRILWERNCHIQGQLMDNRSLMGYLSLVPLQSQGDLK
jgi:hypothetical protein